LDAMGGGPDVVQARIMANLPMRRLAEPDEIVEAMLFACAPGNSFMTGQTLVVDGGLSAV
ncbi:SDR family oxidoreductase, partial [Salinarimonas soli]